MTAQITDTVFYQERRFSLVGSEGRGLFKPQEHGLSPVMIHTACWSGYYCTYEIAADNILTLKAVYVGLGAEDCAAADRGAGPQLYGTLPHYDQNAGCYAYTLAERMPFTGTLLLGADFVFELYVHMGFHPPYKYREVHELTLENGVVVKSEDLSAQMAALRANLDKNGRPRLLIPPEPHTG